MLVAEWKIYRRLQEISSNGDHHEERSAIGDAVNELLALKLNTLHHPDWIRNGTQTIGHEKKITQGKDHG